MNWDLFKPSMWLKQKLAHLFDRAQGSFYEGPTPPKRLAERVRLFRAFHPNATAEQWEAFARQFGTNCYREGFTRGFEWLEREWGGPIVDPEQAAEMEAHDWSLADEHQGWQQILEKGYDPRSPLAGLTPEQRRAIADTFTGAGSHPVEIDLSAYDED